MPFNTKKQNELYRLSSHLKSSKKAYKRDKATKPPSKQDVMLPRALPTLLLLALAVYSLAKHSKLGHKKHHHEHVCSPQLLHELSDHICEFGALIWEERLCDKDVPFLGDYNSTYEFLHEWCCNRSSCSITILAQMACDRC
ncbi:hypothetical protein L596_000405 [Steinernema carpocapsae]|uniref:Uncharacterized protein n=1 Tax=Steinernema carpocapsae TaxID=34508 RepID=A0A4U8UKF4_STECR|nr:hypothetical protein L596_000405 [Steinernema carpocapsae]